MIHPRGDLRKAEFVVQECLNSGTRDFVMFGSEGLPEFFDILTSPRYVRYINPTTRFPNLKLIEVHNDGVVWMDKSGSDDKKES